MENESVSNDRQVWVDTPSGVHGNTRAGECPMSLRLLLKLTTSRVEFINFDKHVS